jgi:hypothetical protein
MPALSVRIFALRNTPHMGCCFHYDLEKQLGDCLFRLNDYTHYDLYYDKTALSNQIALQVAVRSLYEQVEKIEEELKTIQQDN